ncbi:GH39 family glycosyl hydrolase [Gorillibacterium massiliense]|uniref:GH39 family glycosyl hydrolase n=1 Tax=Gorillibacterium massiliense TaxID=1280390 RepID=UPI0004ACC22A|nr:hypothetical protein [Gorillibacterium massiliense]
MTTNFKLNAKTEGKPFPHYWETCVGSCHAYMGLREDWRSQLKKAHDDMGFKYVRFHGLLDDRMSVFVKSPWTKKEAYSFYTIDSIFDFLLENGMKPFVELSYMPEALASGKETIFHYKANITPPSDYERWEELIRVLVQHLIDRYGLEEVRTWYFEVWNEPNLTGIFWTGTMEDYFKLYRHAVKAIKEVDDQLPVGGPATSKNSWIPEFLAFCKETGTPVDFVSTHQYPSDEPLWRDEVRLEDFYTNGLSGFEELLKTYSFKRGVMQEMALKSREEANGLPLYYTEWNAAYNNEYDEPSTAVLAAKTIFDLDGVVDIYSFWTFSDLFEESQQSSVPFHNGMGLQTIYGTPKPTYRMFEMLHKMGTTRLQVECNVESTVEMAATREADQLKLMVYNHQVPNAVVQDEEVCICVYEATSEKPAFIQRVDRDSANPRKKWEEMGRPAYPNKEQLAQLFEASVPKEEFIQPVSTNDGFELRITVPAHGLVAITIEL